MSARKRGREKMQKIKLKRILELLENVEPTIIFLVKELLEEAK